MLMVRLSLRAKSTGTTDAVHRTPTAADTRAAIYYGELEAIQHRVRVLKKYLYSALLILVTELAASMVFRSRRTALTHISLPMV